MAPSKDQAFQFAVMLQAGLPAQDAILYFTDEIDDHVLEVLLREWLSSRAVNAASLSLNGKPWNEMSLDEKIRTSLDLTYSSMAYFLLTHNYGTLGRDDKAKADSARAALEAKLAGTAGKGDALSEFFADLRADKLKDRIKQPIERLPN
jgi:hypothetical protein